MGEEIPGLDLEEELNFIHKDCVETYKLGRERGRKAEREELEELIQERIEELEEELPHETISEAEDSDIEPRIEELEGLLSELDLEE